MNEQEQRREAEQRRIAEGMGIPWERYAARCREGVRVTFASRPSCPERWFDKGFPLSLRFRWLGLPRVAAGRRPMSVLRVDRSKYPMFELLNEEDRAGVQSFPLVGEGESVSYCAGEFHGDVARMTMRLFRWRGVLALYAGRTPGKRTRFGLDFVCQLGQGHWHEWTCR